MFVRLLIFVASILIFSSSSLILQKNDNDENELNPVPVIYADKIIDETESNFLLKPCHHSSSVPTDPNRVCGRQIIDGLFTDDDIDELFKLVNKGMALRESVGGPTILDLNTGYIRDSKGLINLFVSESSIYTDDEFALYGRVIKQLKNAVRSVFPSTSSLLRFTAPTFFTRIDSTKDWKPQSMHDEYWHAHADMNNTAHYHYSGLLYMSTYMKDFSGGRLHFLDENYDYNSAYSVDPATGRMQILSIPEEVANKVLTVEPRRGRVAIFSSGAENPHYVEKVLSGERFVLSFWFTTDETREFQIFLDGKAHTEFSKKMKESMKNKMKK